MLDKEKKRKLKRLLNEHKNNDYVDYIRERWTDEEIVEAYLWARELGRNEQERKDKKNLIKTLVDESFKKGELKDD